MSTCCKHLIAKARDFDPPMQMWCADCCSYVHVTTVLNNWVAELRAAVAAARAHVYVNGGGGGGHPYLQVNGGGGGGGGGGCFNLTFGEVKPAEPGHPLGKCIKWPTMTCGGPNATCGCGQCVKEAWQATTFHPFPPIR